MSRLERTAELIRDEVSLILRKKINDPRIGFASLTRVSCTDDLKHANIFVSVYGSEQDKNDTMSGLESAKGFIRSLLAAAIDFRSVPEIHFTLDESIERASRVFEIMHRVGAEKAKGIKSERKRSPKKNKRRAR